MEGTLGTRLINEFYLYKPVNFSASDRLAGNFLTVRKEKLLSD